MTREEKIREMEAGFLKWWGSRPYRVPMSSMPPMEAVRLMCQWLTETHYVARRDRRKKRTKKAST